MKHMIRTLLILLIIPMAASAQFEFTGVFPADSSAINSHGVAIDADGKVWNGPYFSILINDGAERINPVYIYNADGTQASFSPIIGTTAGDSLLRFGPITGVSLAADGAIYVASHGFRMTAATDGAIVGGVWNSTRAFIHKINAETGAGIAVVELTYMRTETASHAPNRPAVSDEGYVAFSFVFPASPILIVDSNDGYGVLATLTDDKTGFSRTIDISGDATMVFNPNTEPVFAGGPPGHIQVWKADSVFEEFKIVAPLAIGTDPGAIARLPGTNILFASGAGSGNAPLAGTLTMGNRYYGYSINPENYGQLVAYFDWNYGSEDDPYKIPRALAFSPDGLVAIAGSFSNAPGALQRFATSAAITPTPMVPAGEKMFNFAGLLPEDGSAQNSHGVAIDRAGKVWNGPYFSILINDGAERINPVFVYNDDGTQASFSPIIGTTAGDSLLRFGPITGVSLAADGAIYVASHGFRMTAATDGAIIGGVWNSSRAFIHKIDAETGEGIAVVELTYMRTETASHAPNRPAVSDEGYVAFSFVFPASPILIVDSNDGYGVLATLTDDKTGFSRTIEISGDATMIFNPNTEPIFAGGAPGHIQVWKADSVFDEFEIVAPLATGTDPGAIARLPGTDILFASGAGSGNAPLPGAWWMPNRYYGFSINPATFGQVVGHFDWNYASEDDPYKIPRALAFSPDGQTAVAGSFSNAPGALQKFITGPVSIDRPTSDIDIAQGYVLNQNYPNPFNPSTTISFTLPASERVQLSVYNTLGQRVATLVNDVMPAGTHSVNFNAANLASGVYIYQIQAGTYVSSRTMMLIK
jgi:WD40 repeat protein